MISVWCVCVGDKYNGEHVENLRHMVEKNLSIMHTFNVLYESKYTGWWAKIDMLAKATGPCIYFDLDTIIVGNLDYLADYAMTSKLAAAANWGQSGHGGIQSSVLCWNGRLQEVDEAFNYDVDSKRLHGDQCFLTEMYGDNYTKLPGVYSYKYHAIHGLPRDASAICFHGKPDYWEVNQSWIDKALS